MKRALILMVAGLTGFTLGCSRDGNPVGSASDNGGSSAVQGSRLNGGGSTFVYPMMSKWASEFDKAKGVKVNYQSIGSGGGIQQMTAKTFDFGCTDGPMNEEQLKKAAETSGLVVHIPLVLGAVVPAFNLPGVDEPVRFTGPVLADIFLKNITKWNDPALKQINQGLSLPDQEIALVHRSEGSGTTYIWADYLSKISPLWKTQVGVATALNWPAGVGQKGNEGVAGYIARTPGSLGYIELTYALQNNIKFGTVQNREGEFVRGSLESVTEAADAELTEIPDDLRYSITNARGKKSYPISGTVWAVIYVNQPSGKGKQVVDFLRWVTHEGQQYAEPLNYAKLPATLVKRLEKKLDDVKTAS